jgi:hypothetical protein
MITVTLSWPADRRCCEYDADMPALISSIFLSKSGEIFAVAAVVEDSDSRRDV